MQMNADSLMLSYAFVLFSSSQVRVVDRPFPPGLRQVSHNTTQHNITQHNTTQHNTTQHNKIEYDTIYTMWCNIIQCNTIQYNYTIRMQHNTTQCKTIQHDTIQYNEKKCNTRQWELAPTTLLHCTMLSYITLYDTTDNMLKREQNKTTWRNLSQYKGKPNITVDLYLLSHLYRAHSSSSTIAY